MDSSLKNDYSADITPPDVAVWTLNRVEESNCSKLVKREVHMSDKPEPDKPNLKGFDSLPFDKAEEVLTGILLESTSPREALRILKAIPDRKDVGVDLIFAESPSGGTVKVRLEEGQPDTASYRLKDVGVLHSDGRIVTRQMPNVLPDLQFDPRLDTNAKQ
jgi:hypothetical protein